MTMLTELKKEAVQMAGERHLSLPDAVEFVIGSYAEGLIPVRIQEKLRTWCQVAL